MNTGAHTALLSVLRLAVPRLATVAAMWGTTEDIQAYTELRQLQEKLLKETKTKS